MSWRRFSIAFGAAPGIPGGIAPAGLPPGGNGIGPDIGLAAGGTGAPMGEGGGGGMALRPGGGGGTGFEDRGGGGGVIRDSSAIIQSPFVPTPHPNLLPQGEKGFQTPPADRGCFEF